MNTFNKPPRTQQHVPRWAMAQTGHIPTTASARLGSHISQGVTYCLFSEPSLCKVHLYYI